MAKKKTQQQIADEAALAFQRKEKKGSIILSPRLQKQLEIQAKVDTFKKISQAREDAEVLEEFLQTKKEKREKDRGGGFALELIRAARAKRGDIIIKESGAGSVIVESGEGDARLEAITRGTLTPLQVERFQAALIAEEGKKVGAVEAKRLAREGLAIQEILDSLDPETGETTPETQRVLERQEKEKKKPATRRPSDVQAKRTRAMQKRELKAAEDKDKRDNAIGLLKGTGRGIIELSKSSVMAYAFTSLALLFMGKRGWISPEVCGTLQGVQTFIGISEQVEEGGDSFFGIDGGLELAAKGGTSIIIGDLWRREAAFSNRDRTGEPDRKLTHKEELERKLGLVESLTWT